MEFRENGFKYQRTGFFSTGDTVKVYYKGEEVDEFDLLTYIDHVYDVKDWEFADACRGWYREFGDRIK